MCDESYEATCIHIWTALVINKWTLKMTNAKSYTTILNVNLHHMIVWSVI